MSSDRPSPEEKAFLLIGEIERKITASETGHDFIVLCEILSDSHEELRELSTVMKKEYGTLCYCYLIHSGHQCLFFIPVLSVQYDEYMSYKEQCTLYVLCIHRLCIMADIHVVQSGIDYARRL